jgi:sec-independent protein translocase protein TatA
LKNNEGEKMFANIGVPELLIVLVIVILVFGVGRLSKIGGELGGAIHSFRKGINGEEANEKKENTKDEK